MAKFDMDGVDDLFDDMADMMADQEEIQDMMGRNFGVDYDESDLLGELEELDEEIIGDQLNEGLGLPSYIP
jgi:charged multivesicular body protein 5